MGKKGDDEASSAPEAEHSSEETSTFSADEGDPKPKAGRKLRKTSSEGGNLGARARQAAALNPGPEMPKTQAPPPPGMF